MRGAQAAPCCCGRSREGLPVRPSVRLVLAPGAWPRTGSGRARSVPGWGVGLGAQGAPPIPPCSPSLGSGEGAAGGLAADGLVLFLNFALCEKWPVWEGGVGGAEAPQQKRRAVSGRGLGGLRSLEGIKANGPDHWA